jgi:Fibronectin type III-like domain
MLVNHAAEHGRSGAAIDTPRERKNTRRPMKEMRLPLRRYGRAILLLLVSSSLGLAAAWVRPLFASKQEVAAPAAYLDPDLAFEARAADLVSRLTVEEKISQLMKDLRGFERVPLAPGEQRQVTFTLTPATALAHYDPAAKGQTVAPDDYELQVGASSRDIRLTSRLGVRP